MKKALMLILALGCFLALPGQADALSFKLGAAAGYNVFFDDLNADDPPSGLTYGLEFGVKLANIEIGLDGYYQSTDVDADFDQAINGELELTNFFLDASARFFLPVPAPLIDLYIGGGVTFHIAETDVLTQGTIDNITQQNIDALADDGVGVGIKVLAGVEAGTERIRGFAEIGYRYMLSNPNDVDDNTVITGLDAVDFNNLPITVGVRLRF